MCEGPLLGSSFYLRLLVSCHIAPQLVGVATLPLPEIVRAMVGRGCWWQSRVILKCFGSRSLAALRAEFSAHHSPVSARARDAKTWSACRAPARHRCSVGPHEAS